MDKHSRDGHKRQTPKSCSKSCINCKKSHTRCSNNRPCERCLDKGLLCTDSPATKQTYIFHQVFKTPNSKKHDFNIDDQKSDTFITDTQNNPELLQLRGLAQSQYQMLLFLTNNFCNRRIFSPSQSISTPLSEMSLKMVASLSLPVAVWDKNLLKQLYCNAAHEKLFHNGSLNSLEEKLFDCRYKEICLIDMAPPMTRCPKKPAQLLMCHVATRCSYVKFKEVLTDCYGRLIVGTNTFHFEKDCFWSEFNPEGYLVTRIENQDSDSSIIYDFKPLDQPKVQYPAIFNDSFEMDGVYFPSRISKPDITLIPTAKHRATTIAFANHTVQTV